MDIFKDEALARRLAAVRPSPRQVAWQKNEFTAFLHFGINTFTNSEWGGGNEDAALFAPTQLDTDQWCQALAAAGITACILTAKHHDGFCLWHTGQTRHSVAHSPFKRDVAALLAASCQKYGLKLGFYLSPWDRHEETYGAGTPYDDFFCRQLEELLTGYGELYCLWFDGACGEGPNGRVQEYDWGRYYTLIRQHQPNAAISICGPDVRWCGNEAGDTREEEWSVVPTALQDKRRIQAESQQTGDEAFRTQGIKSTNADLGSRTALQNIQDLCWYPAEVDVSIRPGWFYRPQEDGKVKSLETLLDLYDNAAGGNAVLLLNIPPDTRGLIHEADAARLRELGDALRSRFAHNVASSATACAASSLPGHGPECALQDDESFWKPAGQATPASLCIRFTGTKKPALVVLAEQITQGQRIERFCITAANGEVLYEGKTVGNKKICKLPACETNFLKIEIQQSRTAPTLRFVGVYE